MPAMTKDEQHGRAGVERRGIAGADEDAGADDAADAEEHQVPRAERALQLAGLGFVAGPGRRSCAATCARAIPSSVPQWPFDLPSMACLICARNLAAQTARAIPDCDATLLARQHRPQRLAAEDMDVEMRHFLAARRLPTLASRR